jgi:hypothetical protein
MKYLLLAVAAALVTWNALGSPAADEAKKVFDRYVALERNFDPAVAELYADDATLKNMRRYPDGTSRTLTVPAAKFKQLIKEAMAAAKKLGDTNKYSAVSYKEEDDKVRITATRSSDLKKSSSPMSLVVAKRNDKWLIVEELSESTLKPR